MSDQVKEAATNVTTYFQLKNLDGTDATGKTITAFDLSYTRSGAEESVKVDATALASASAAHADNKMFEVDSTDSPGKHRIDWPDAAFAGGVREVLLTVKHVDIGTTTLRVLIDAPVNVNRWDGNPVSASGDDVLPDVNVKNINGSDESAIIAGKFFGSAMKRSTVSDAGATASDFDTALSEITDDHFNGQVIVFVDGVLKGQAKLIDDYDGTGKNVTIFPAFTEAPGNGDEFIILPISKFVDLVQLSGSSAGADNLDNWDEVHYDSTSPFSGTAFPNGKPRKPVDDIDDAISIGDNNNLETIVAHSAASFTSGATNKKFRSHGGQAGLALNGQAFNSCEFRGFKIDGINTGVDNGFTECQMEIAQSDLGVDARLVRCILESEQKLRDKQRYIDCQHFAFMTAVALSAGNRVDILNGAGGAFVSIVNLTVAATINIIGFKGDLVLDASCTAGTINVIGFKGKLTNNATSTVNVVKDDLSDAIKLKTDELIVRSANGALTGGPHTVSSVRTNLTEATNDHFNNSEIHFTSGVLKGQSRFIKDYVGATKDIVPKEDFTDIPADADTFDILPVVDSMAAGGVALTRGDYVDFMNKAVVTRTSGNPTQYTVGTGPNQETIDATFVTIATIPKADSETVA